MTQSLQRVDFKNASRADHLTRNAFFSRTINLSKKPHPRLLTSVHRSGDSYQAFIRKNDSAIQETSCILEGAIKALMPMLQPSPVPPALDDDTLA